MSCPRAAVVFAIGALDAYLTEASAEILVEQFRRADPPTGEARQLLGQLSNKIPSLAIEVAFLEHHDERSTRVQTAIVDHFQSLSRHGPGAVAAVVRLVGGNTARVWDAVRKRGVKSPESALDEWTEKRHTIVHRGEKARVPRKSAERCVILVRTVGEAMESEVARVLETETRYAG